MIRPNTDLHGFEVECYFTEDEGVTILKPNDWKKEGLKFPQTEDERCSGQYCFSHTFEYAASTDQIEVFIGGSTSVCNNSTFSVLISL